MADISELNKNKSTTWAIFDEPAPEVKRVKAHIHEKPTKTSNRRQPRQERSRFTVAAILEAAAIVIDEMGWDRASTNRIAERAGVSIGSLYQYFPNKEAILAHLVEQHRRQVHVRVAHALERLSDPASPLDGSLRGLFEDLVQLHREDPVLARVLSTEVPRAVPVERGADDDRLIHRLEEILVVRPDVKLRDTAMAAHVVAITTEALTRWMVHEAPDQLDVTALIDEIVAMLTGYLTRGGAPRT